MRVIINIIFMLAILILLCRCEDIDVIETDVPYEEHVVVRAELVADVVFSGVSFTKTLPLNVEYTIEKAELKNVVTYIQIDRQKIIPLYYSVRGIYKPVNDLLIEPGKIYELYAKVGTKNIYAYTTVPDQPQVHSVLNEGVFLSGKVESENDEIFGAIWAIVEGSNTILTSAGDFYDMVQFQQNSQTGGVYVRTIDIPELYLTPYYSSRLYIRVYAYDEQYLDYFSTQNAHNPIENIFAQSGGNIIWNVQGDAIGLFIGVAKGNLIRAN